MRSPARITGLVALFLGAAIDPSASSVAAPVALGARGPRAVAPTLVLERSDVGSRADGLAANRLAVYPDGTVLTADTAASFVRAHLDAAELDALTDALDAAHLEDLPAVVASRAEWFDLGDAWCSLSRSGTSAVRVRIDGDLRAHSADRALAPHGFVEVLERLEAIRATDADARINALRIELELVPWTPRDASPFLAEAEREPLDLAPDAHLDARDPRFVAEGALARDLASAARSGRAVRWSGRTWRLLARPEFPHESDLRDAGAEELEPATGGG